MSSERLLFPDHGRYWFEGSWYLRWGEGHAGVS